MSLSRTHEWALQSYDLDKSKIDFWSLTILLHSVNENTSKYLTKRITSEQAVFLERLRNFKINRGFKFESSFYWQKLKFHWNQFETPSYIRFVFVQLF